MKNRAVLCGLLASAIGVQASVTSTVDELVMVSFDQDSTNSVGTVNTGLTTYDFAVRERSNAGQSDRRIVSYIKFDLSGLTTEFVNSDGFTSILTLDYSDQLNTANSAAVRADQVAGTNTWSDAPGSYPLASWYTPSQTGTGILVLSNVATQDPAAAADEVVLDITGWVQDWVNGTVPNNGLAFFIPTLTAQAAGFTVTSLISEQIGIEVEFTGAVDSDWSNGANWETGMYPAANEVAVLNSTAVLSNSVADNILSVKIGVDAAGTLNLQSGSALQATAAGDWGSQVGCSSNQTGVINQTGGSNEINYLEIGAGGSGLVDLSGGRLILPGSSGDYSVFLGTDVEAAASGGDGTIEISGGTLMTDSGIYLGRTDGSGTGTFSVQGAGADEIMIGTGRDGSWVQNSNSVLRAGISTNGITPILIADTADDTSPLAVFAPGSMLHVEFIDGAMEAGSWAVMVSEGTMSDFGMVFDPAMGSATNDWGFRVIDATLYVGYGLGWSAGGEYVTGQSTLIDATFNGIDDGVNESFSLVDNNLEGGIYTWSNASGEAAMTFTDSQPGTVGCVSDAAISGAAYNSLTTTFTIDDIIDDGGGPAYNGHWIGLIGNNSNLWNNAEAPGGADGWAVGIRFLGGSVTFVYDNTNGNEVVIGSLGTYTAESLLDGYTAKMIMNTNGWSVAVNSIDTTIGGSGGWPADFDYAYIGADPDLFASMFYQGNVSNAVIDITSISVAGIIAEGDNDGDGIPNSYESIYGLDPEDPTDRDEDLDGDGMTNYEEYVAGTAANDAGSLLKFTAAEVLDDGGFVITWQSVEGKSYSVITNTSLFFSEDGITASNLIGLADETSYTSTVSGAAAVFYEVTVEE